jgi:hypothetical protein
MSALEIFVRIRQYKDRAAEFFDLAAQPFSEEVRARYLAVADHYMALADAEIRADRLTRQKRLDHMRSARETSQRLDPAPDAVTQADHPPPARPAEPAKLRVVHGTKRRAQRGGSGPAQMAAQADFTIVKSAL